MAGRATGQTKPRMTRRNSQETAAQFGRDPVLWATWLYFYDHLRQEDIAAALGVSRATVINYLAEARKRGLVTTMIKPAALKSVTFSKQLCDRFGLSDAMVVPDDRARRAPVDRVGEAGALYLRYAVRPGEYIGVAWGRTVLAMSNSLVETTVPDLTIVQIVGSMPMDGGYSADECTATIARRLGARCVNLHVPALVSRAGLRHELMAEPLVERQFAMLGRLTQVYFGICSVAPDSLIFESGLVSQEGSREYLDRGAIGVIAGRFYDVSGQPVIGSLDDRMIGMSLEDIRRVPNRIAVAAGLDKVDSILGALRGGYVTCLITDEPTARAITTQA